jgi:7,8-dihydropterin-6-yl-methyl-4-(beta-D-ribofuranosyl)aminobenzene 5'-phosphate synthase
MRHTSRLLVALAFVVAAGPPARAATRITIIVDAFGIESPLRPDWGFSALVEHEGKRILFDTGNNSEIFEHNSRVLGVDLTRLDFVVISHRHGDHTDGLHHVLKLNPRVKVYAPDDEYFGGPTPAAFFERTIADLPPALRYFGGRVPESIPHGSPWKAASIERIVGTFAVAPGIRLVSNISPTAPFNETPELSLALETPTGQVLVVACSHPGIERILASVNADTVAVRLVIGGLHLVTAPDPEIARLAAALRDRWNLRGVAPGHCTGEPGFAALKAAFGTSYTYAGLGTVLDLP